MEPDHTLPSPEAEASRPESRLSDAALTQAAIDAPKIDTRPVPLTAAGKKQASYGALISIIIIMAIVVVGAFYAWGKRIHDQGGLVAPISSTTQTY